MADKINKIKLQGSDTEYELESTSLTCNNGGVRIDDDTEGSGLRDGSTVLFNSGKNVNLESGKNIQIKSKKGKLVCDTTETIKAGNGNELQIISKVKENIKTGTSQHRTESSSYCGDHGDILMEVRRLRIKPFNVPKWTSSDSDNPSSTTAHSKEKYDGYIYLDTAGYEDVAAGGNPAESASSESTFEIRVGNNGTSNNSLTTGEYRPLTVKTRGIDLRCMTHGGIAVQPCGYDEPNNSKHHENKIKFESSRIQSIYADDIQEDETGMYINNTKSGYIYQSGTPAADKWVKGGDGLEFGTFNNLHTSLFTRDYRFNENGIVYAVDREIEYEDANGNKYTKGEDGYYINGVLASPQPVIVKADYKTQLDDFKDKISTNLEKQTRWKDIIKTANAFNGAKSRHAKSTTSGNLEIQTNHTYVWTIQPEDTAITGGEFNGESNQIGIIYNSGDFTELPDLEKVYGINGQKVKLVKIDSGDLRLYSEADVDIHGADDVIINAQGAVKVQTPELRLADSRTITANGMKITKKGAVELGSNLIVTDEVINRDSWLDPTTNKVYVIVDTVYDENGNPVDFTSDGWSLKKTVYTTAEHDTPVAASTKLLLKNSQGETWYCDVNKSSQLKEFGNADHVKCEGAEFINTEYISSESEKPETATVHKEIGGTETTTTVSLADIAKLVNWMKTNNQGPWAQ